MKRRNFLTSFALGGMLLGTAPTTVMGANRRKKKRSLRFAHITDMHIKAGEIQKKGIQKLIDSLNQLSDRPDFILNTGDNVFDSLQHSKKETLEQWDTWEAYFNSKLEFPLYNCLGNHDVWGWYLNDESVLNDPDYGKVLGLKKLGMKNSYDHFQKNDWHFILLDSLALRNHKYYGNLGEKQMNWLNEKLESIPADEPVCIASHIPIVSPAAYFVAKKQKDLWEIQDSVIHSDFPEIKDLFYKHPNIKIALSGHLHLLDKANYLNVNYLCDGAICGKWWEGKNQEFGPAYALYDFYPDGSFDCQRIML